ncbi:YadA-like family protein [Pasteurella caecimuris]|uniref:YadA-like family protein n=1 Tax=Rodentibacter caecimuris TaxID=1796644 RepID=UPI00215039CF|nr:YadA-like family protein [Pasteurella caecimuris]MCR1836838.1 YadA-like family protein [Pasteurella caecimuris]MCU0107875.1 YadA-like family protein [Pasteurella caecimuris]
MNKIFRVIWNHAAQTWVAVSELSKVKAISSSSTSTKPDSLSTNLIKTVAITLPLVATPIVANAYIEMGGTPSQGQTSTSAKARPGPASANTWAYDYKNPGNKSYRDTNKQGNIIDGYSSSGEYAFGIAIGNKSSAVQKDGTSNGIAVGDYAQATGGLATAIGAFSNAEDTGATAIGTASRAKGFNSLAMMRQSAAIGDYSAAIGSVAYAKGSASFAFGASATSNGNQSIAIGNAAPKTLDGLPGAAGEAKRTKYDGLNNTQSNGERSVAIGSGAKTNGNDSFAFGSLASTGEFYSAYDNYLGEQVTKPASSSAEKAIAFGTSSRAIGNSSIAFGYNSLGAKNNSIAFGVEAKAHKNDAVAFGSNANATEANSIAFGSNAQALHENVITIGKNSKATKKGAMSIGEGAISNANNSLSLGNGTVVNQADIKNANAKYTNDAFDIENGVVAIANKGSERRLVNLAAGREDTDAVNVKQLSEVNDNLAKSIAGDGYIGYSIDATTGRYTYKAPEFDIKNQKLNNVKKAVELAQTNYVSVNADKSKQKEVNSNYDNLGAKGTGSIALGEMTGTGKNAKDSISIGHNTNVAGANTVAIGANISADTASSVILGDNSTTTGSHATETVANKTIGGHTYNFTGSVQDAGHFVSIGGKGKERQIKNVAAGHVEANSTDAINGSQLYAVASRIEQGWKITTDKAGSGEVAGNKEQKIAMGDTVKVIAGNNINITQHNANLTIATKENVSFTKVVTGNTTLDDKGLTIKDGPKITKDGVDAGNKKITNVSNGTIDANSRDAINGSQLFATNQNVTNNTNNIANNTQNISNNTNDIAKGLNFQGDNTSVTVNRKLGETLSVTGGAAENNLSDNNIGVVGTAGSGSAQGGLAIKLAKDLKDLNSVNTKEIKLGDQTSNTTVKYDGDRIKYGDQSIANLGDEKHITKGEYAVQNDGSVTMTYTDGNGKAVANETAKITGIAKQDLSNINNSGETKIKNLAKATINMEDGKNTKVSYRDVNDVKTFKVDVEGALADVTSITNGNGSGKVEFRPDGVVNVSGNNTIGLNGKDGHITGLTNTDWNVTNPTPVSGRAATEDQLKTVSNVVNTKIGDNNIKLGGNSGTTDEQNLSKAGGLQFYVVGGDSAKYVSTTAAGTDVTVDLTKDTKDKIDNAANVNLTNINDGGKTVIRNEAKKAVKVINGKNTAVTKGVYGDVDTYAVNVEGGLTNITSITGDTGTGKINFKPNGVVTVGSGNTAINFNGDTGDITGLTNKTLDGSDFGTKGRAATEEQLSLVNNKFNNTIKLGGDKSTATDEQALNKNGGLQFNVVSGDNGQYVSTTAAGTDVTVDLTKDTKDKIDNASDKNLNNITNEGKKVITGLGTIVEAGSNVIVTNTTDATTGQKTYTVSAIAQNLGDAELSYKANGENQQKVKVSQGLDFTDGNYTTATVAENGKVQYDVNVGNITTGADGKAGIDGSNGKNTVATVKTVVDAINNSGWLANATKSAGELDGTSVATKVAPSAIVNFDAGKNLMVKQDVTDPNNQTYTYSLANDITIGEKGKLGTPGKDGIDGKIGINGKDGSSVVINGKDGSIGLNGTNGSNGLTIKGDKGAVGVDGTDGANGKDGMTRIVYKDDKGTNHTVATLEDGLRFTGNNESVENKHKLNTLVKVQGEGIDEAAAKAFESAAGNINVVADGNNKLEVKLNKDINLTDKGSVKVGNTAINNGGMTIANPADTTKNVSLTNSGLNNGGNQIKNVANGTNPTDAVNLSQLDSVKSAERHIKPGEYQVNDAGIVTMSYVDGDGKDVAGEAKITNIAKSDLKNITNDGKKVITGLGTIVQSGSKNVTVTPNEDQTTGQKTYTVSVAEQNLGDAPLTYKANGTNDQSVTLSKGLNFTDGNYTAASVGKDGIVKYDVKLGTTPTTPINGKNGKDGANGIATVHQVIDIVNNSGWNANATGNVNGSAVAKTVRAGAVVNLDAGKNLTITQSGTDEAQTYSFALNKDLTNLDKIVVNGTNGVNGKDGVTITGPNGQNGEDGKVGISGKDGKDAVSISAKDGVGHIGLTGPKGADGSDGVSADISVKEGKAGVDGEDGKDGITRIVYKDKDGKEHEVATHDDGMKYYGDAIANTNVIKKHLNEQVNIIGGITDRNELSEDNNIGVISDGSNNLTVRLAKNLNGINSVGGNNSSIVFTGKDNNDPSQSAVTIKGGDVSIDGNKITNLKDGEVNETSKDAVNGSQLYNVTNAINTKGLDFGTQSVGNDSVIHKNLGEKLEIVGKGGKSDTEYDATNIKTITENGKVVIALAKDLTANNVTVGEKGANGKDGVDGSIGVNGKDGSAVVINGKDGSIGLNGKDGANALTIKGADGKTGVDGKAGENKTRIVYETKDPKDPNKTIIEEVATLNDGLKFKGDKGDAIAKKLNEELEILGKLNANADVTDKNLRVDNESDKLILKMAKVLQDLTSAQFIDEITSSKSVINGNGLTITPKDAPVNKTVSVTDKGLNNGGNQIVNVDSGLRDANGNKVSLTDAKGDTLNNAVNVGDLKESINNITDPSKGGGFGLTDENGNDAKAKLGETVTVKGDVSVTTKVVNENGKAKLQVGLNKDVTIGNNQESGAITVKGENGQDGVSINGKDGSIGLKDADGKDAITLNGKDGTIGINGKDGSSGVITVVQGQAGLDGNDGKDSKTKTRIVYKKPNGETEEVATLNDGLRFTGNNEVVNSHKLNSVVTIKGEGIDKDTSENFKSAKGNINVKADGKGTLEVQLAKDLKNVDSISNKDGQKIEFKAGGTTISGGNLSVDDNKITNVKAGEDDTDAVNVKQLKDGIAQATTTVNPGKNIDVIPTKNADGSTTYTVKTKDNVDFTSVTTGNTTMNDSGITIRASDNGKTNVVLTNKGLDNGGNKVVNVADGEISSTSKDAVNGSQLHNVKQELVREGLNFKGQSGQSIHKNLGETLEIVGKGEKADTEYDAANIKTYEENGKVVVALAKDLTVNKVTVGEKGANGKDGADGSIGVNGKDGSSVVINGKDGSIGLNGKDGKNGISIKGQDGKVGVDGKDGETRLVYVEKDNPNKTHEIATTDDGLKFTGNNEVVNSRKLNSTVTVKGEGVSKSQSENFKSAKGNINVKADGKGTLEVQLTKDIDLGNDGSVRAGNTVVNNRGISVKNGPSMTADGIDAGNKKITHVAPGEVSATSTDAVNGSQLYAVNRNINNINNNVNSLNNKINKVDKDLRAGIAGAAAIAGLPQVRGNGKSMVAVAASNYRGENAVALGYTKASDNGKVLLKLSGSTNTRGDVVSAVGLGYEW